MEALWQIWRPESWIFFQNPSARGGIFYQKEDKKMVVRIRMAVK